MLHEHLRFWWSFNPPIIPSSWKMDAFHDPKTITPSCATGASSSFSPPRTVGKAIIGLLSHLAMKDALTQVVPYPVWAYVEHRSTLDAIRRVSIHCVQVRTLLSQQRSTPHARAAKTTRFSSMGAYSSA